MSSTAIPPTFSTSPLHQGSAALSRQPARRWSRRVAVDLVAVLDILAVLAGAFVPAFIYAHSGHVSANWIALTQTALLTAVIVYGCLRNWNMYDLTKFDEFPADPGKLIGALSLSAFAVLGLGMPFAPADLHLWVWYAAWLSASFTFILGGRILARTMLAKLTASGRFDTRVAVFGAGTIARNVNAHLKRNATLGIRLVGVFDDRNKGDRNVDDELAIDGTLEELIESGRNGEIDQIIIALPQSADRRMAMIAQRLEQLPVSLHVVTHMASELIDTGPAHKVSSLGAVGLLDVKSKPLSDWAPMVKRVEDNVIASILLVLALPLLALAAIAIKLETPGPALFSQRRRGLNHSVIEVLKLRTMTVSEDNEQVNQATASDPRVTRVGWILRRTSIDELPQLFNVLRGEMSLVGPRPHALVHDDKWGADLESYSNRHQVKPGITGLAQVEGWRGEIHSPNGIRSRIEQDLLYIRNWSLWLDLMILARTVRAVVIARNAY